MIEIAVTCKFVLIAIAISAIALLANRKMPRELKDTLIVAAASAALLVLHW